MVDAPPADGVATLTEHGPIAWGHDVLAWMLMRVHDFLVLLGAPTGTSGVWLLTVVLFPVLLRTLLLPLFVQQIRGSLRLTKIQQELTKIRDSAAGDRELMHQQMMEVYAREKVSPFASCLPMVIQITVFGGMFWVLSAAAFKVPVGSVMDYQAAWDLSYTRFFTAFLSDRGWQLVTDGTTMQAVQAVTVAAVSALVTWASMVTKIRMPGAAPAAPTKAVRTLRVVLPGLVFGFAFVLPLVLVLFGVASRIVVWVQRTILMLFMRSRALKQPVDTDAEADAETAGADVDGGGGNPAGPDSTADADTDVAPPAPGEDAPAEDPAQQEPVRGTA